MVLGMLSLVKPNANGADLYIDGAYVHGSPPESAFSAALSDNYDQLAFAFRISGISAEWHQIIERRSLDDCGIWNRALTEEEVLALYNPDPPPGCTDPTACNFDLEATSDDGSCIPSGCMETDACNYNALAECEGEACDYTCCPGPGCCSAGMYWDYDLEQCLNYETCQEDLDGDGVIGINDLMELLSSFGTMCEEPETGEFTCGDPMNYHGYDYATVQIGDQCWFAENLRTEHYANGDSIPANLSGSEWDDATFGAVAVYGEGSSFCFNEPCDEVVNLQDYGRLYNWYAVDDARGLCPSGWHVPTDDEFTVLTDILGGTQYAGEAMKSSPTDSPAWDGTNSSGFSGLAGGYRVNDGVFDDEGDYGYFWSASATGADAWRRRLDGGSAGVYRGGSDLRTGFSVRCVRD